MKKQSFVVVGENNVDIVNKLLAYRVPSHNKYTFQKLPSPLSLTHDAFSISIPLICFTIFKNHSLLILCIVFVLQTSLSLVRKLGNFLLEKLQPFHSSLFSFLLLIPKKPTEENVSSEVHLGVFLCNTSRIFCMADGSFFARDRKHFWGLYSWKYINER